MMIRKPVLDIAELLKNPEQLEIEKERFYQMQRELEEEGKRLIREGKITSFDVFNANGYSILNALAGNYALRNIHDEVVNVNEKMCEKGYLPLASEIKELAIPDAFLFRKIYDNALDYGFKGGYKSGYQEGRKIGKPFDKEKIKKGEVVRVKNADDHAKKMYEIFQTSDEIANCKSGRAIAKLLNDQNISTARGGQWHSQTVQDLYKRWEKLGLRSKPNPE